MGRQEKGRGQEVTELPSLSPGVSIEELPSGVRTISGVATSITAFIGRSERGPANKATAIHSFADFQLQFGGLSAVYPLSYTVRDFFLNGGNVAIVVRLQKNGTRASNRNLNLEAVSEGDWGNKLTFKVDYAGCENNFFNLTVFESSRKALETFKVSIRTDAGVRRLDRVLAQQSRFVRLQLKKGGGPRLIRNRPAETKPAADPSNPKGDRAKFAKFTRGKNSEDLSNPADFLGDRAKKTGLYALEDTDLFNLLCIPPDTRNGDVPTTVYQEAMQYCVERRALLIVDPPAAWTGVNNITANNYKALTELGLNGQAARNAALYFPRVIESDPLNQGQPDTFVPCGIIAGVIARTDSTRGVWKAPAGTEATLSGVQGFAVNLTDSQNGQLNPFGVNCLRSVPTFGRVVWGARTLRGADASGDEYKYIPVRRLALYLEESIDRGTKWAVFEPNVEPLWAQIRLNIGAFMHNLFRQGAFQGNTPGNAYFVKCDKETTLQNDIDLGLVNIVVGFAALKPAEFVVIKLQQMAGQERKV